jgi:hypothetical protein
MVNSSGTPYLKTLLRVHWEHVQGCVQLVINARQVSQQRYDGRKVVMFSWGRATQFM